jgi:hypothetical protein
MIIAGIILITASCKKNNGNSPGNTPSPDVYVFGYDGDSLKYWKNGISNQPPAQTPGDYINTMFVAGNDVYFVGGTANTPYGGVPGYWKNGALVNLPDSGAAGSSLKTMFVSGADVYTAGTVFCNTVSTVPYTTPDAIYPSRGHLTTYWKNGVPTTLQSRGRVGLLDANAYSVYEDFVTSMYVSGADVYVAGGSHSYALSDPTTFQFARYWKNGVLTSLTNGLVYPANNGSLSYPTTTAIVASGSDVYVAGWQFNSGALSQRALYWKNGSVHFLTDSISSSSANAICVSGNDVYVAGYQDIKGVSYATYWKNGVATTLTTGTGGSEGNAMTVSGSDVYVAGWENINGVSVAKYWKNGIAVNLSNGTKRAAANGIYVGQ